MKGYMIPAGTDVRRFNRSTGRWEQTLTTKPVTYTDKDLADSFVEPDVGAVSQVFRLPDSARPYSRVAVRIKSIVVTERN